MRQIKVGSWFNNLTEKEQALFKKLHIHYGTQYLRSFFTIAHKTFGLPSQYDYITGPLRVIKDGNEYHFSSDRKEFNFYN